MRSFRELTEAKEIVVFAFGRFNPPTTGHEKLIEKVASVAKGNPFFIYPSHTTGPKDPLPHAKKVAWMRKLFPKYKKNIIADKNAKTAIMIAEKLYKDGYKNLIMVAGSDRVEEFNKLLQRYNDAPDKKGNQLFKFDSIKVVSAGARDPDAEGVEGMSASKMRKAASDGKFDDFKTGIPDTLNDADKKKLYFEVRKAMGIREEREMGNDYDSLRDAYLTGKIWNVGEVVEANGVSGEVVRKGTNYLSYMTEDGKVFKAWLHEIEFDEEKVPNDDLNSVKTGGQFGKKRRFPTFVVKKEGIKYKAYDEQNDMQLKAASSSLEGLAKLLKPYIEKRTGSWKFEEVELDERNYAKEYANYQGTPEQIARRSSRNKARRVMGNKAIKGMDVGHKDNDPLNNSPENLRNEDPSTNRREPRLREKPELDESWYKNMLAKMNQISHPKAWEKVAKEYAAGMDSPKHRAHPSDWAQDVARHYSGINGRQLVKYINKLVDKGKLPKELKAELQIETFKSFIDQIQVQEVLGSGASQKDYIDDFIDSDAPQFKGKNKKERIAMAIAAFRSKDG